MWADTAYRSARLNLALLERRGLESRKFQRKSPGGKKMPAHIVRGNATLAPGAGAITGSSMSSPPRNAASGLIVRTVGMVRARAKIGMANLVYNFARLAWPSGTNRAGVTHTHRVRPATNHTRSPQYRSAR